MAAPVYEDMINLINALPEDATDQQQRELLGTLIEKIRANIGVMSDKIKKAEEGMRMKWSNDYHMKPTTQMFVIKTHIRKLKEFAEQALAEMAPPQDEEMAMGGRKRRTWKKAKKPKNQKRYTRRR